MPVFSLSKYCYTVSPILSGLVIISLNFAARDTPLLSPQDFVLKIVLSTLMAYSNAFVPMLVQLASKAALIFFSAIVEVVVA